VEWYLVLVGSVGWLDKQVSALVRLNKPVVLMDLPEVDIPTRSGIVSYSRYFIEIGCFRKLVGQILFNASDYIYDVRLSNT
jgi:hypothetical protein